MSRVLLINAAEPGEIRAALVSGGEFEEYRCERASSTSLVGNVYRGIVVNVERGMEAAFVDIGMGRNGFLHVSACVGGGDEKTICELFGPGDSVLVQVTRESVGGKGPVLTGDVSLPGRFLVLLPFSSGGGVSRRIQDDDGRAKMRTLVRELEERANAGLIVRTAGADRTAEELERDLNVLQRIWEAIERKAKSTRGPSLLYRESDLVARALRDMVDRGVLEVVVDTPEALARAEETAGAVDPELRDRLRLHDAAMPLFHAFEVEEQVDLLAARRIPLPGGGSLVFDHTEALVAIDVNSGRMREEERLEETALKTNLEAARELARHARLRNLGGLIVVDFIDMREPGNVRQVEEAVKKALGADRARLRAGRLGDFGLFAFTRRRDGSLGPEARRPCPRCSGAGEVPDPDGIALRVFRELRARAAGPGSRALEARVSSEVAEIFAGHRRGLLEALGEEAGRPVAVAADPGLPSEGWVVDTV